jgi:hypothetical protein
MRFSTLPALGTSKGRSRSHQHVIQVKNEGLGVEHEAINYVVSRAQLGQCMCLILKIPQE